MSPTVTIAGTAQTVNIVTATDVEQSFIYKYGDRVFSDPYYKEDTETEAVAAARLRALWVTWASHREDSYGRMYQALAEESLTDPTENYDRKEEGGWTDTSTIGERESNTDTTPAVVNTSEQYIAGDDSSTPVLASKNVVNPGGQTDNVKNTSEEATDTVSREYEEYRVHGNIGVSTAADMAEKIINLHGPIDLTEQAIKEFVDIYTIYR